VSESIAKGLSFATSQGAQTSIGCLPIVYYGTDEQKAKYLPGIANATLKTSYCLTEPNAGSDANSGITKAILNDAGTHYIINGQKMWITNGGYADLMIVFAKIDQDEDLSAFIVEYAYGGITRGAEEKKLGLKGSSTVQLFFNNTPVPIENLLGVRAGGFKIALNILNTGRIKLAAGSIGGCKLAIDQSISYAKDRIQFNKSIIEFGAIQHKIGEMASRTFCNESALYRAGYNIDAKIEEFKSQGETVAQAKIKAVREYAVECAILKVHCSEAVDFCIDEALQIYGGMGFSAENTIEAGYRDSRILRIYEGTNEINRMLAFGELMKRAFKTKEIDLQGAYKKIPWNFIKSLRPFKPKTGLTYERFAIRNIKNAFILMSAIAGNKLKTKLIEEQELVMMLSDILAEVYIAESALFRIEKLRAKNINAEEMEYKYKLFQIYLYESVHKVRKFSYDILNSISTGLERRAYIYVAKTILGEYHKDVKMMRREVTAYLKK
jgi:alkylation response protein AidB-like acyl-CoA dehydrogenase